jgi:hypothetical protein
MNKNIFLLGFCAVLIAGNLSATDWYVDPDGMASNSGTIESPWDIASCLEGKQQVRAGDTVYFCEGVYKRRPQERYGIKLIGTKVKPIHLRPILGARVTIDGGLEMHAPSAHVWLWELEIMVSEPRPEKPTRAGSHPEDLKRPWGGLHMFGGKNCKYINLVIHDCNQGISCWKGETDCEIYGCIIYNNGWLGEDRGHGHCIYTQNDQGVKTISNCIMSCRYDGTYSMHAYGSERAYVNNYLVKENIVYEKGPFLIGGGRASRNIRVFRNYLYNVNMRIGYTAPHNVNCEIRDNVIFKGALQITKYQQAIKENNRIIKSGEKGSGGTYAILLPNQYDAKRAHVAIYNWSGKTKVAVELSKFLRADDTYQLLNPKDVYGQPIAKGVCRGDEITVPAAGEFTVYVLRKE